MKKMNGLQVYEADESPGLPEGLTVQSPVVSRFGFEVGQLNGKPVWEVATEADFRESEARRLGIEPENVTMEGVCFEDMTMESVCCHSLGPMSCIGLCPQGHFCKLLYHPMGGYYYCRCL